MRSRAGSTNRQDRRLGRRREPGMVPVTSRPVSHIEESHCTSGLPVEYEYKYEQNQRIEGLLAGILAQEAISPDNFKYAEELKK